MSPALRKEIEHWLFLESWDGFLPWRSEKHTHVKLFSDSSHFAWGGALSPNAIEVNVYDYWDASVLQADIATKETLALNNVLESFADSIKNSWVDAFVDSMVLVRSWTRQGSRFHSLTIGFSNHWPSYPLGSLAFPHRTGVASALGEQRTFKCFWICLFRPIHNFLLCKLLKRML